MSEIEVSPAGKSVRLFLVDGTATGLLTAEIMNWTGHALITPRSRLVEALKREETQRTGVYILIGDDPEHPSRDKVYIGEGDNLRHRLKSHAADDSKDFWERACLITSKDLNLTKAHVRYLESKLISMANRAGRATIANATAPETALPESDTSDMDYFLSQIQLILPVVGINAFRISKPVVSTKHSGEVSPAEPEVKLKLSPRKYPYEAIAVERDGEFVVLEGSTAAANPDHMHNQYAPLRDQLIRDGVLVPDQNNRELLRFTRDYVFRSSSAAGAVVNGRNTSGPKEWRLVNEGVSLKEYQTRQLEAVDTDE